MSASPPTASASSFGRAPEVGPLERLYRPLDAEGRPLAPINEGVHPSVRERFGREVRLLAGDDDAAGEAMAYRPKNLLPLLS